ncbi:serine threonine- kinase ppk4-like [Paramuricea clavata]|uniref:Serine threonine- kinase ppk4-like n=1 Tax=Paramuricea clavata TaxID=317549 RepID=A0A6S7I5N1_PARCT|nr:serine threonine- kinase ppk4-like [Paramuricea clavata]
MDVSMQAFFPKQRNENWQWLYVGVMEDGSEVAVKRTLTQSGEDAAKNENEILNMIKTEEFPFIVSYRHCLRDDTLVYLIIDLCEENLNNYIQSQNIDCFQQHGPRMIKEILTGLTFLQDRQILLKDLKPLNIFIDIEGRMRSISRLWNKSRSKRR